MAYERELAKALESLEGNFKRWRKNKITAFELSDLIHKFHNGIARELWGFYTGGHSEMIVAQAITKGIILKSEISPGILQWNRGRSYFLEKKLYAFKLRP